MTRLLSLAALAALVAAGTAQARTVDRTVSCSVSSVSGLPSFGLDAGLSHGAGWSLALKPGIGQPTQLVGAYGTHPGGLFVDAKACRTAARIPLARAGLPAVTVLAGSNHQLSQTCSSGSRIAVHVHTVIAGGSAVSGQASVRTGAKLRPLLYITWTPKRLAVYASADCTY